MEAGQRFQSGRFRKRPVIVSAVRYEGDLAAIAEFFGKGTVYDPRCDRVVIGEDPDAVVDGRSGWVAIVHGTNDRSVSINTLEGPLAARVGDWIIKGLQGEFYPCKPDIFEATYEWVGS